MGTTTTYGINYPASTGYVKDGATNMQTLAENVDTVLATALNSKLHAGLVLVKTQTVGTAVTSVSVTSAFSTTYDGYKIIMSGGTASANNIELGFGLNGITTNHYSNLVYGTFASNAAPQTVNGGNTSYFRYCGNTSTTGAQFELELWNPFLTKAKWGKGMYQPLSVGNVGQTSVWIDSTTSATGFTISCPSGNITGCTIYVYGYAKD